LLHLIGSCPALLSGAATMIAKNGRYKAMGACSLCCGGKAMHQNECIILHNSAFLARWPSRCGHAAYSKSANPKGRLSGCAARTPAPAAAEGEASEFSERICACFAFFLSFNSPSGQR